MRQVMIRCPETGKLIVTGVCLPADAPVPGRPAPVNAVGCPFCGDLHTWSLGDACQQPDPDPEISMEPSGG